MSMSASVLFTFISFLSLGSVRCSTINDCPNQRCFCFADEDLECTELFLHRIPQFLRTSESRNLTYNVLDLSDNQIKRFGPRSFKNVSVRSIKMWNNKKKVKVSMHSQAFQGLDGCLENINFRKNVIPSLPDGLFRHLHQLTTIELKENKIEHLGRGVFKGAENVRKIFLDNNRLQVLKEFSFIGLKNLEVMTLTHNQLNSIDMKSFYGLRHLEFLDLRHNLIRDIQPKTFLRLKSLKKLDLSHNIIPALFPIMFRGLKQLDKLLLRNNRIVMIAKETFSSMESLTELHLEKNKLTFLIAGVFNGLSNLGSLFLGHNLIRSIPDRLFHGLTSLSKLNLEYNDLTHLNACSFDHLKWEGGVWLTGNPLHCNCLMAWTSKLGSLKVYGKCKSPNTTLEQEIRIKDKYEVCQKFGGERCRGHGGAVHYRRKVKKHRGGDRLTSNLKFPHHELNDRDSTVLSHHNFKRDRFGSNEVARLTRYHYMFRV